MPLAPIEDDYDDGDNAGTAKKRKVTTAADVKLHMSMAAKDKNKAQAKEIKDMRAVFSAYMRHPLLRPILDQELGPLFFKKIPGSKEELQYRLDEIRSVFNRAGITDRIIQLILYMCNTAEKYAPQLQLPPLDGLTVTMAAELEDMKQMIAELECEYGGYLEASLAKRFLMHIARVVQIVIMRNQTMLGQASTPVVPVQVVGGEKPPKQPKKKKETQV